MPVLAALLPRCAPIFLIIIPSPSLPRHFAAPPGALELLAVTPLMRFKDDVSIRVRQASAAGEVVVDVRSASRVGKGDLGCNAARIDRLLAALRQELGAAAAGSA